MELIIKEEDLIMALSAYICEHRLAVSKFVAVELAVDNELHRKLIEKLLMKMFDPEVEDE